jgi:hypothetical protein
MYPLDRRSSKTSFRGTTVFSSVSALPRPCLILGSGMGGPDDALKREDLMKQVEQTVAKIVVP